MIRRDPFSLRAAMSPTGLAIAASRDTVGTQLGAVTQQHVAIRTADDETARARYKSVFGANEANRPDATACTDKEIGLESRTPTSPIGEHV